MISSLTIADGRSRFSGGAVGTLFSKVAETAATVNNLVPVGGAVWPRLADFTEIFAPRQLTPSKS